ncbi:MAG: hypothetical protein AB8G15_19205 [Saprospiraceae bacterium]
MKQSYWLTLLLCLFCGVLAAQYSQVSDHIPMKDFLVLAKQQKLKSVTRLFGIAAYDRYPEKHFFDENGYLVAWHTSLKANGIYTYELDTLGRIIKSYHFDYPKTDRYERYSVKTLDTAGIQIKREYFYANGVRYHYKESTQREANGYIYLIDVEGGNDSSVIRIKMDTINKLEVLDYFQYKGGVLTSGDSNFSYYNKDGKVLREGSLSYDEAWRAWIEQHPEETRKVYNSLSYCYELVDAGKLDETLFEFTETEVYTYFENGAVKRAKDYLGIREYEYNDRGFPERISFFTKNDKLKSVTNFFYDKNGLLQKELSTAPDGTVKETLNYEYTFW